MRSTLRRLAEPRPESPRRNRFLWCEASCDVGSAAITAPAPRRVVGVRLSALLALTLLVGCGGKAASVSGTVTVDGKSLDQGSVIFSPAGGGMRASGIIQSDGSYQIQTNRDSGLDVGEYDVAVVSREVVSTGPNSPPRPGKYLAPKIYGKTQTSGLHFSVEAGSNTIDLALKSDADKTGSPPSKR